MLQIQRSGNDVLLELGGGSSPVVRPRCQGGRDVAVDARICYDREGKQCTDFVANFNEPLPIGSSEFDGVLSIFAMEHISYTKVPQFIAEVFRVLKPGGAACIVIPNTEAQLRWILNNPQGWDGKDLFESASCKLFGDQRHGEREGNPDAGIDSHKTFFNPAIAQQLFSAAGFVDIQIEPFGQRATDQIIRSRKPGLNKHPLIDDCLRSNKPHQLVGHLLVVADSSDELAAEVEKAKKLL